MELTRIAVLGAGSWGTTYAKVMADAGVDVVLWARRPEVAAAVRDRHENPDYLPGIRLPGNLTSTSDPAAALAGAEAVVLAVPSQSLRANLAGWRPLLPAGVTLASLAKGWNWARSSGSARSSPRSPGCRRTRSRWCPARTCRWRSPANSRPPR
ncbi:hypothetical protein GCM10029964_105410 [Kibdelosporangium lantanae]